MLEAGQSQPWQETLQEMTGTDRLDAQPTLDSFAPSYAWLKEKDDAGKPGWSAIDQQTLDCWDGRASLELLDLRTAAWDDLVLPHVNLGHGSGDLENQRQVYSVLGGKLVKVLETMDLLSEETIGTSSVTEQRSTFSAVSGRFVRRNPRHQRGRCAEDGGAPLLALVLAREQVRRRIVYARDSAHR